MAKSIMLMGTSSHVGKSILTTALCRIFHQEGRRTVPFKAQNMALNSYVTLDGREMGRAQVAQAEAAGLAPMVDMNPVLLKPTGNAQSQVVIMGEPVGNMSAREYHKGYSLKAWGAVEEALERLREEYDLLVIEGAGSPAEINLKANDIVNMRSRQGACYQQIPWRRDTADPCARLSGGKDWKARPRCCTAYRTAGNRRGGFGISGRETLWRYFRA